MKSPGPMVIGLVLLAITGCAGGFGPATVAPTVDVSGKWAGSWVASNASLGGGSIEMTLKQTGSEYSGNLLVTGTLTDPSGYTQGVVSGNEVRILQPSSMTGSLTVQGDSMSGNVQGERKLSRPARNASAKEGVTRKSRRPTPRSSSARRPRTRRSM